MSLVTAIRKSGEEYIPQYISNLKMTDCIGCGRCFKACSAGVFELMDKEDLDEFEEDEDGGMVARIAQDGNCIGCQACSRVCPKNCHSHEPLAA